jgi:hypothetical protein
MKFQKGQKVRHVKSGHIYFIHITPDKLRIEASGEPAYAYGAGTIGDAWVRSQSEMEDGRFELMP